MPGYYSGYSNIRMALDIAVVLAYLTDRTLVPYRFRMPRRQAVDLQSQAVVEPMLVPELFDLPVPYESHSLLRTWLSVPEAVDCAWPPLFDAVYCEAAPPAGDDHGFTAFRNGRRHVLSLTPEQHACADLHVRTDALAHYSHFFHLEPGRREEVVQLMRRMQPKAPYRQFADRVVCGLGHYNAIHVRRGDFLFNELSRDNFIRSKRISGQEIVSNLATRMDRDDPLVICTDGASTEELFGPLRRHFRRAVFLHEHLRSQRELQDGIAALPRFDEDVEALITQQIASRAAVFAGTMFSTFTALIHRLRALDIGEQEFLYAYDDFQSPIARYERCAFVPDGEGPWSWNRLRMPVTPDAYSWLREWPECAGLPPPPGPEGPPPPGALELTAQAAELCGSGLHLHRAAGQHPVIDGWTDVQAFVRWPLDLPVAGAWSVEVRYAGTDPSVAGRYELGVEGRPALQGRVWSTCSALTLSPWMPVGRLELPAGRSQLTLRPFRMGDGPLMVLQAVRLLPV